MTEKQTPPQGPSQPLPVQELTRLLETSGESSPATVEDFQTTEQVFDGIIDTFHRRGAYPEYKTVSSSEYVRRVDEPADAPRFEVVSDPKGELEGNTNMGGKPAIRLHFEHGQKDRFKPLQLNPGAWRMVLTLFADESGGGIKAGIMASIDSKDGRESLTDISPQSLSPASKELLDWVNEQVGAPEDLELAHTKKEKRWNRILGAIGLNAG